MLNLEGELDRVLKEVCAIKGLQSAYLGNRHSLDIKLNEYSSEAGSRDYLCDQIHTIHILVTSDPLSNLTADHTCIFHLLYPKKYLQSF